MANFKGNSFKMLVEARALRDNSSIVMGMTGGVNL